jgi:hypothetical protein
LPNAALMVRDIAPRSCVSDAPDGRTVVSDACAGRSTVSAANSSVERA